MTIVAVVAIVAIGYLVGSVPVARVVTGRDLRTVGDGNPGYWNAKQTVGRRAALPVFIGDVAKGAIAAAVGAAFAGGAVWDAGASGWVHYDEPTRWWLGHLGGLAAMVGHAWPVFDGFRGGRSVLTFVGAALVVAPVPAAVAIAALAVVWLLSRSFAVAARVGVAVFPVVQGVLEGPYRTAATGVLMTLIGVRFAQAAFSGSSARRGSR